VSASDRVTRRTTILLLALALAGCASQRDLWPVERLDPYSAVTTTIMSEPWVYGRDVPSLAANSRDYVNLGLVQSNRAGQRAYWLGVVSWSTIDRSALGGSVQPLGPGKVLFNWADGSLELKPVPAGREVLGASEPIFSGPQPEFQDAWYMLTAAQLSRLAAGPPVTVSLFREDGTPVVFERWHVDRRALDQFLEATGFTPQRRQGQTP
jgi:hypothetical protein